MNGPNVAPCSSCSRSPRSSLQLAVLLSCATKSVADREAIGGLLNAALGNLTELVIALTALQAGWRASAMIWVGLSSKQTTGRFGSGGSA